MATKKRKTTASPAQLAAAFEKVMVGHKETCKRGHKLTVENVRRSKLMHGVIACLKCFASYAGHAGGGKKKAVKKAARKRTKKIVPKPTRPASVPAAVKPAVAPIPPQPGFTSQRS